MGDLVVARLRGAIGEDRAVAVELARVGVVAPVTAIGENALAGARRIVPQALVNPVPDGPAEDDIGALDGVLVIDEVAQRVHHIVRVLGDVEGLGILEVRGLPLHPAHAGILVRAHIHDVVVALVVRRAREVARLDGTLGHGEVAPGAGFVAQRPNHDAGLVLVALDHIHHAVDMRIHPLHRVRERLLAVVVPVRLNVRLILHIDTVLIAEVVEVG